MSNLTDERVLRRLLALRSGIPHLYLDDGEAQGEEQGIRIDFMREPVADLEVKLLALNAARMACGKSAEPCGCVVAERRRVRQVLSDMQAACTTHNHYDCAAVAIFGRAKEKQL